jgi:hypothetical protein
MTSINRAFAPLFLTPGSPLFITMKTLQRITLIILSLFLGSHARAVMTDVLLDSATSSDKIFTLPPGKVVILYTDNSSIDPFLVITKPDGSTVSDDNSRYILLGSDPGNNRNSAIQLTAVAGTYKFRCSRNSNALVYARYDITAATITSPASVAATKGVPLTYTITWTGADPEPSSFQFVRNGLVGISWIVTRNENIVTVTPTTEGTAHYWVRVYNGIYSSQDTTITSTALPQTIDFPPQGDICKGESKTLSASTSANLPVTFTIVSGPGIISGNTLNATGAGSIVVRAASDGGTSYVPVQQNQTIQARIRPSITSASTVIAGTGMPFSFTLTAAGTGPMQWSATGLPAWATLDASTGIISGTPTNRGTNEVIVTVNDGTSSSRTLTITTKLGQTITFPAPSQGTVATTTTLGGSASSGLPVTYTFVPAGSESSGAVSITGSTIVPHKPGTFSIKATQNGNELYAPAAPISQNLSANFQSAAHQLMLDVVPYYGNPRQFRRDTASAIYLSEGSYSVWFGGGLGTGGYQSYAPDSYVYILPLQNVENSQVDPNTGYVRTDWLNIGGTTQSVEFDLHVYKFADAQYGQQHNQKHIVRLSNADYYWNGPATLHYAYTDEVKSFTPPFFTYTRDGSTYTQNLSPDVMAVDVLNGYPFIRSSSSSVLLTKPGVAKINIGTRTDTDVFPYFLTYKVNPIFAPFPYEVTVYEKPWITDLPTTGGITIYAYKNQPLIYNIHSKGWPRTVFTVNSLNMDSWTEGTILNVAGVPPFIPGANGLYIARRGNSLAITGTPGVSGTYPFQVISSVTTPEGTWNCTRNFQVVIVDSAPTATPAIALTPATGIYSLGTNTDFTATGGGSYDGLKYDWSVQAPKSASEMNNVTLMTVSSQTKLLSEDSQFNLTGDFEFCTTITPGDYPLSASTLIGKGSYGSSNAAGIIWQYGGTPGLVSLYSGAYGGSRWDFPTGYTPSTGIPFKLKITRTGYTTKIYIDNEQKGSPGSSGTLDLRVATLNSPMYQYNVGGWDYRILSDFSLITYPTTCEVGNAVKSVPIDLPGTYIVKVCSLSTSTLNSSPWATATITATAKQPQAIAFTTGSEHWVTDAPVTLLATSTSGLPVSFAVISGPASLAGNILTFTGSGTIKVRATQNGDTSFDSALPVDQIILSKKAPVFTSPATASGILGQPFSFALTVASDTTPLPTYSATGLPSWATLDADLGLISGTPDALGTSNITLTASNGVPVTQSLTLTVNPQYALTVGADAGGTVTGAGLFVAGTAAAISASPAAGYAFDGWYGADVARVANPASASTTIAMSGPADIAAHFIPNALPAITAQPWPAVVNTGAEVDFSVTATGPGTLSYQWFVKVGAADPVAISGATSATYLISNVTTGHAGIYTVRVTNSCGTTTSSDAELIVHAMDPADSDNDGLTNGQESLLGTSPTTAAQPDSANTTQTKIHRPN